MPEGLPEHRQIIAIRAQPDDMLNADSVGIASFKPVGDVQRVAFAFAPAAEKALVPAARRELIPDKSGYAARVAGHQPGWPVAAERALPPISGHEAPNETKDQQPRARHSVPRSQSVDGKQSKRQSQPCSRFAVPRPTRDLELVETASPG